MVESTTITAFKSKKEYPVKLMKEYPVLDEDITHFPERYGENYLYLLEVDPNHLHVFWEITTESLPAQIIEKFPDQLYLNLRIKYDFKNHSKKAKSHYLDIHIHEFINDYYIEIKKSILRCHAELGYYDPDAGGFVPVCSSNFLEIEAQQEIESDQNHLESQELHKTKGNVLAEKDINFIDTTKQQNQELSFTKKIKDSPKDTLILPEDKIQSPKKQKTPELPKADSRSYLVKNIDKSKIIEYYKTLLTKSAAPQNFTPWRLILESMSPKEVSKKMFISTAFNIHGSTEHLQVEAHFSNHSQKK